MIIAYLYEFYLFRLFNMSYVCLTGWFDMRMLLVFFIKIITHPSQSFFLHWQWLPIQGVFPPHSFPGIGSKSIATLIRIKQLLKMRVSVSVSAVDCAVSH